DGDRRGRRAARALSQQDCRLPGMSAEGPPQGTSPLGGAARSDARGEHTSADTLVPEWRERVRNAQVKGTPLRIRGGGTKDFYGERFDGEVFEVAAHAGIVDYDPTELVITARGGTKLTEIEAALGEAGQFLGFEPPHFGPQATLGGCIA